MIKNLSPIQTLKLLAIALVIGLGATYADAWVGPTATAPNNNVDGILNVSTSDQRKGGVPTPNIRLDVDNASTALGAPETLSSQSLLVDYDVIVGQSSPLPKGDVFVNSLTGPKALCADPYGTVALCP